MKGRIAELQKARGMDTYYVKDVRNYENNDSEYSYSHTEQVRNQNMRFMSIVIIDLINIPDRYRMGYGGPKVPRSEGEFLAKILNCPFFQIDMGIEELDEIEEVKKIVFQEYFSMETIENFRTIEVNRGSKLDVSKQGTRRIINLNNPNRKFLYLHK